MRILRGEHGLRAVAVAGLLLGCCLAQDLTLPAPDGQQHSLAEYRGKVVVVNFWATWCVPCRHEMPLFAKAQQTYGDALQVVAVSIDAPDTRSKVAPFVAEHQFTFPILLGSADDLTTLGLGEAIPATAFLDENGQVVARILGEASASDLRKRLDWLVKKKGSQPPALLDKFAEKKKKQDQPSVPFVH